MRPARQRQEEERNRHLDEEDCKRNNYSHDPYPHEQRCDVLRRYGEYVLPHAQLDDMVEYSATNYAADLQVMLTQFRLREGRDHTMAATMK